MKKTLFLLAVVALAWQGLAQDCYWVFFADKAGTTFDPYSYFDAKAIARYRLNHADLYDSSNYPVQARYERQVAALAQEEVGVSRWLNAVAVVATPDQVARIEALRCVRGTARIAAQMLPASHGAASRPAPAEAGDGQPVLANQLLRMQGQLFRDNGIDGKGVRVAVFDGGFPAVNTHQAFKHLRDNNQIVATWNFCNKKEDVYGWNSHGTMVLSCIAGVLQGKQLGLATGSTFLLARTEVDAEPYKEEVWWQQAVEWADKNGADVINSSLGYGKDRHYTYQMDGRSTVAHAANMAARKGILVCNSAGNEASDKSWKTIITPGDADSVLTVGGIEASLDTYSHISFSSYGPTADGRMKPNVCNFGQADVALPRGDDKMGSVFGTSFSSPLTAGFVACARQTRPNLTAMQLKAEVEQSADLYPYFDYAYGYGVPQASYFVSGKEKPAGPTFVLEDKEDYLYVRPTGVRARHAVPQCADDDNPVAMSDNVFMKVTDSNGLVQRYVSVEMPRFDATRRVSISKRSLAGLTLTIFFDGYAQDYALPKDYAESLKGTDGGQGLEDVSMPLYYEVEDSAGILIEDYIEQTDRSLGDNAIRKLGDQYFISFYSQVGQMWRTHQTEQPVKFRAPFSTRVGINFQYALRRWYRLGVGLFYGKNNGVNLYDTPGLVKDKRVWAYEELGAELFQRIRLKPGGMLWHNGLFLDLGVYGSWGAHTRQFLFADNGNDLNNPTEATVHNPAAMQGYKWNYGVGVRLVNDWYGIFANYRLNGIGQEVAPTDILLPRLTVGIMVNLL